MNKEKGTVTVVSGVEKIGEYQKVTFVIDTGGKYPKDIAFDLWNERTNEAPKVGSEVEVEFSIKSRQSRTGWFTNLTAQSISYQSESNEPPAF